MEELNKNQIVLLTLLVSFVTSIATGIVTVTLMDQAPSGVTQTINQVVERTIEKVVPGEPTVTTVVREVPVVITEEKLIVDVVNSAQAGTVRILDRDDNSLGSGFIAAESGVVVTVASVLVSQSQNAPLKVVLANDVILPARRIRSEDQSGLAFVQLELGAAATVSGLNVPSTPPATPVAVLELHTDPVSPGQTVVAVGRPDRGPINVSGGIVSTLASEGTTALVRTAASHSANLGGPLLGINGKVIGVNSGAGLAISAITIQAALGLLSS